MVASFARSLGITADPIPGSFEERYRALFDAISEGVVIQDEDGKVVSFNDRAPEILGVTPGMLAGTTSFDPRWRAFDADGRPLAGDAHPATIARLSGRPVKDVILGVETSTTPLRWLRVNAMPITAGVESPGVVVTFSDVTELKVGKDRAHASEQEYRQLIDSMQVGMWMSDRVTPGLLFVNDALCKLTGYTREQLLAMRGADFTKIISASDLELLNVRGDARLSGEAVSPTVEIEVTRADGAARTCLVSGTVVYGRNAPQLVVAVTDITEAREAENARRELEKLESLAILAGGVAHDFNNKLLTVMGNASLALMDLPADHPLRPLIEEIHLASTEAAQLSRQMLDYSGRGAFVFGEVNLRDVVRTLFDETNPRAHPNRVEVELEPLLPVIPGDGSQLRRLLANLVSNSIDALDIDGTVRVAARVVHVNEGELASTYLSPALPSGRYVLLQVIDDGHGIRPEIMDRVFDPFFSTRFPGRGLGLAGVLGIVRGHGGAIQISSEPGLGTVVSTWLPVTANPGKTRLA